VGAHGSPFTVYATPDDPAQGLDSLEGAPFDDVLVLASVDPALGVDHVVAWATAGVTMVTAGKATHVGLNEIGLMLRQAGIDQRSAILVGADPDDDSVGLRDSAAASSDGRRPIETVLAREF
jgi:hypothetical protein